MNKKDLTEVKVDMAYDDPFFYSQEKGQYSNKN